MKYEEKLESSMRRAWADQYMDYRGLKKLLDKVNKRPRSKKSVGALQYALLKQDSLGADRDEFLNACRRQYQKVQTFYQEELERSTAALWILLPQLHSALPAFMPPSWSEEKGNADARERHGRASSLGSNKDTAKRRGGRSAREKTSCMRASVELFRNLTHLTNFCILNYTGFVKICKKHDKAVLSPHDRLWDSCLEAELEPLTFVERQGLGDLINRLEQGYADAFCDGNVQMAKAALLMRQEKSSPGMALTLGVQIGACVMLSIWTAWDLWVDVQVMRITVNTDRQWKLLSLTLPIYRACGSIILGFILWAGCLQCWKTARINYLFMFDLEQDAALSPTSALVLASRLCIVFLLSALLVVKAMIKELPHWMCQAPGIFPASMLLAMVGELMLHGRFRFAFRSLGRVLAAPLYTVDLWSSFVGDVLTSLVKPMTDMAYSLCYIAHGEWLLPYKHQGGCADWWAFSFVIKPLLCALPLWCRFMQSLRVYHDTLKRWPALGNATKYAIAHLVVLFGALHNPMAALEDRTGLVRCAWLAVYFASTLYTFIWDVRIDWRLGQGKHRWLRERRMFSREWLYYAAIGADFVLRFFWTATLVPGSQSDSFLLGNGRWLEIISSSALAAGEMCRRAMWAVLRLEAEHLHNTEGLRRVEVIPLHFDRKIDAMPEAQSERRCGVLVELLAYATVVGIFALVAALTRPHLAPSLHALT